MGLEDIIFLLGWKLIKETLIKLESGGFVGGVFSSVIFLIIINRGR